MSRRSTIILTVFGSVFLLAGVLTLLFPFFLNDIEGTLEVNWANPVGIQMKNLQKGDNFDIEYSSETNVSLYLLTDDQANQYRSPEMDKDPLPEPLMTGKEGEVVVKIEKNGDYEVMFLPEEPARTFTVDYRIDRSLVRERVIFIISSIGLFITSLILFVLGYVLRKKASNAGQM